MRVAAACDHALLPECPPAWHKRWTCQRCGACWRCGRVKTTAADLPTLILDDADLGAGKVWYLSDEVEVWLRDGAAWWPLGRDPLPPMCGMIAGEQIVKGLKVATYCARPSAMAVKARHRITIEYFCTFCWTYTILRLMREVARKLAR